LTMATPRQQTRVVRASPLQRPRQRPQARQRRCCASGARSGEEYVVPRLRRLLGRTAEEAHIDGSRASSLADGHALRAKGTLKEQDALIELVISLCETHTPKEAFGKLEQWVDEHRLRPHRSTLRRLIPTIGDFFTPLPLTAALREYDTLTGLSKRIYVPPNFAEVRHCLNLAQVAASAAHNVRLVTFDADGTLYEDGETLKTHDKANKRMINRLVALLRAGAHVAIVTAAGYPGEAARYEERFRGLLDAFLEEGLSEAETRRFLVLGGECNYLLQYNRDAHALEFVPDEEWQPESMRCWDPEGVEWMLDRAQAALELHAAELRLPVNVIRKERAVGVVPTQSFVIYELFEELCMRTQADMEDATTSAASEGMNLPPYCCFNGGNDVFFDIGTKALGISALQDFIGGARPAESIHFGDRFTLTGNDNHVRSNAAICWVSSPLECHFFTGFLLKRWIAAKTKETGEASAEGGSSENNTVHA